MKVTFSSTHSAFSVKAPAGTLVSLTGTPTEAVDGVYTIGDEGYINIDEQMLTKDIYLSITGEDYTVAAGARIAYPAEGVEVRAGSSVLPFKIGAKGGGGGSGGGCTYRGTTTTAISNGSTTNPITIDGESYTAVFGDVVVYGYTEFVFDGTQWSEFGRPFDTTPTSGSANAVTSDGIYRVAPWNRGIGENSVAGGSGCSANGNNSLAMGVGTSASGSRASAFGFYTQATQNSMIAIGAYNSPRTNDLFNIGNGVSSARSNIVEVNSTELNVNGDIKKNGVSLPTPYTTMPVITSNMLGQVAQYVGTTDANFTKGYFYIASSDGAAEPTYSWVNLLDTVPTSGSINAVTSDGVYKNTAGQKYYVDNVYKGDVFNNYEKNVASGTYSHAEGNYATASGTYSHAEGNHTTASGSVSHAEGYYTTATKLGSTAMGKYNVADTDVTHLLIVGNGTDEQNRSNILEVSETDANVNGDIKRDGVGIDDYTTTGRKIGKWIDGSDLYQRTFEVTGLVNGQWNDNVLGTNGIDIVDAQGWIDWTYNSEPNCRTPLNYYGNPNDYVGMQIIYNDLTIMPKRNGVQITEAVITIKYTKPSVQANIQQTEEPTDEMR